MCIRDRLRTLKSAPGGLSNAEAAARLETHGRNRLPEAHKRSALVRLLLQFHNVLIYVLLGSAVITALLGHAAWWPGHGDAVRNGAAHEGVPTEEPQPVR